MSTEPKKPQLGHFGLTEEVVATLDASLESPGLFERLFDRFGEAICWVVILAFPIGIPAAIGRGWLPKSCALLTFGGPGLLLIGWLALAFVWYRIFPPPRDPREPLREAFSSYQEACARYERELVKLRRREERRKEQFWRSLTGAQFEHEVAEVLFGLGHRVTVVGGPGDGGIDLWVDDTIIVQCKAHARAIGPAAVRELLGAKTAVKAERAILIALDGASSEADRWARKFGVEVWDVRTLVALQERPRASVQVPSSGAPPTTCLHRCSRCSRRVGHAGPAESRIHADCFSGPTLPQHGWLCGECRAWFDARAGLPPGGES